MEIMLADRGFDQENEKKRFSSKFRRRCNLEARGYDPEPVHSPMCILLQSEFAHKALKISRI